MSATPKAGHCQAAVTVATVTFNSASVIANALRSAPAHAGCIVVDNASRDDTLSVARAARPHAEIVALSRNVGFGAANNVALARCQTPFLLMLNPDATLGADTVALFLAAAAEYPDTALFGLDTEATAASTPGAVTPAISLSGSCLFGRVEALRAVSGFDEALFLYFDDNDLCLRVRAAGFSIAAVRGARIDHVAGRSTDHRFDSVLERAWLWGAACAYFADKHSAHPEGRNAARKLVNYRRKALLNRLLRTPGAAIYAARVAGAEAVRRDGPAVMHDNAFTGGTVRSGAQRAASVHEGVGACL